MWQFVTAAPGNQHIGHPWMVHQYSNTPQKGSQDAGTRGPSKELLSQRSGQLSPPGLWGTCLSPRQGCQTPGLYCSISRRCYYDQTFTVFSHPPFGFPRIPFSLGSHPCHTERPLPRRCLTHLNTQGARFPPALVLPSHPAQRQSRLPLGAFQNALVGGDFSHSVSPSLSLPTACGLGEVNASCPPVSAYRLAQRGGVAVNESHVLGQPQLSAALHLGAAKLLLPLPVNTDLGPPSRPAHHLWPPAPT